MNLMLHDPSVYPFPLMCWATHVSVLHVKSRYGITFEQTVQSVCIALIRILRNEISTAISEQMKETCLSQ